MPLFYHAPNTFIVKGPDDEIFGGTRATFFGKSDALTFARMVSAQKGYFKSPMSVYEKVFFRNKLIATFTKGKQSHICSCNCFHKDK